MSKLFSLVLLFLAASIFNINEGVALTPLMVLFQHFFITLFPVAVIMLDRPPPDLMNKPPRDPKMPIAHRSAVAQWLAYGVLQFAVTLAAMLLAPGEMSTSEANVPMTTAFVVLSLGSILAGLTMRRDPESGVVPPVLGAIKILTIPTVVTVFAVEAGVLQEPPHDNLTDRRPVARLPGLVADHPGCRRVGQGNSTPPPRTGTCAPSCDHRGCPRARPFAPLREDNQTMMWAESLGRLPGVATARGYRREWLRTDVTAGLVLTALLIPAGMGYAEAAGLPAYAGLYATIVPLLAYAVVGPSKILVLGPDSSLAPLIAAAVIPLAVVGDSENALALAGVLAILVGTHPRDRRIPSSRLRDRTPLENRSASATSNAIALVVVVGQIPKLLGFSVDASGLLGEIGGISKALLGGDVDPLAAAIGVGSLVVIVRLPALGTCCSRRSGGRCRGHSPCPLPPVSPMTSAWSAHCRKDSPSLPSVESPGRDVGHLIGPAAGIALIAFADTGVLSRTFAARHGEDVNGSTEMKAIGVANVAGGLFGGFPISASGSRTPVAEQSGAHTQLAGVRRGARGPGVSSSSLPDSRHICPMQHWPPSSIVAACALIDVGGMVRMWRMSTVEFGLAVAAFSGRRPGRCATRHPCSDRTVLRSGHRAGMAATSNRTRRDGRTRRIPRHRTPSRWASHPRPGVGEV